MAQIRALARTARCMQRLGYLKRLVRRAAALNSSSLENLGSDLVQTVSRKVRVPLTVDRASYVRQRLSDRAYNGLKRQVAAWTEVEELSVAMELQDLYLADCGLPSHTGKLVQGDFRKYPSLGMALGMIRGGTYSLNTRALSLLHFTPEAELRAFIDYDPTANPLRISRAQALLLLYSSLEQDGEVAIPLLRSLAVEVADGFSDRDAGDRLPEIYRNLVKRHRLRLLPADEKERLEMLSQMADSIAVWRGRTYTGGGAREEASRPRLEPYVDMGLLRKEDPWRYSYVFTPAGLAWAHELVGVDTDAEVSDFLAKRFFTTTARAWAINATATENPAVITAHLFRGWQAIQTTGGYAPIEEMALVAGIEALLDDGAIVEPVVAKDVLIAYQKANPYRLRFTVDRSGTLAHASFLEAPI